MQFTFKLPDIGEGVAEGEILKWLVKEGEAVKEDQSLVEVMTDKVNVQIPSPRNGTVAKILVKEGEVVKVGHGILLIEVAGPAETAPAEVEPAAQAAAAPAPQAPQPKASPDRVSGDAGHPEARQGSSAWTSPV